MMKMKEDLNRVKNLLCKYNIGDWSQHTTRMNPASKVRRLYKVLNIDLTTIILFFVDKCMSFLESLNSTSFY